MEEAYSENDRDYDRLARSFRLGAILLNVEAVAWIIDLLVRG